jgi:hypothetical protein
MNNKELECLRDAANLTMLESLRQGKNVVQRYEQKYNKGTALLFAQEKLLDEVKTSEIGQAVLMRKMSLGRRKDFASLRDSQFLHTNETVENINK